MPPCTGVRDEPSQVVGTALAPCEKPLTLLSHYPQPLHETTHGNRRLPPMPAGRDQAPDGRHQNCRS